MKTEIYLGEAEALDSIYVGTLLAILTSLPPLTLAPATGMHAGTSDQSFIVEILGLEDTVADADSPKYYWDDLVQMNEAALVARAQSTNTSRQTCERARTHACNFQSMRSRTRANEAVWYVSQRAFSFAHSLVLIRTRKETEVGRRREQERCQVGGRAGGSERTIDRERERERERENERERERESVCV